MAKPRFLANKVSPLSSELIWDLASTVRKGACDAMEIKSARIDVVSALEFLHNNETITMIIVEPHEMPSEYAVASPTTMELYIREDTYCNAANGVPRDRFTLAHELGHLILHQNAPQQYASTRSIISNHHYTEDAEWQANEFAAMFLIDRTNKPAIQTPRLIAETFGVSFEVAGIVWRKLHDGGYMQRN